MVKHKAVKQVEDHSAKAIARSMRVSPRKLNLVAGLIRNLPVGRALLQLRFCEKRIAGEVKKVLQSAIANAENNHHLDIDRLYISEVCVGKAFIMKRFRARARGRGARIIKPYSRLIIKVSEQVEE